MHTLVTDGCEQIAIGADIVLTLIHDSKSGKVRIGIDAPQGTPIRRKDYLNPPQVGCGPAWQPVPTINSPADLAAASMRIFPDGDDL